MYHFDIAIEQPDTTRPQDRITKIDIVKDRGAVAQEYTPAPGYAVRWTPSIEDTGGKYFSCGFGRRAAAMRREPIRPTRWRGWLPVWTGR